VIPLTEGGKVKGVVFPHKLLQGVVNKKLHRSDLAMKAMIKDFVIVGTELDLSQFERYLERNQAVFIEQRDEKGIVSLHLITQQDAIKALNAKTN